DCIQQGSFDFNRTKPPSSAASTEGAWALLCSRRIQAKPTVERHALSRSPWSENKVPDLISSCLLKNNASP
ncbi:MAG: hypothetical protein ACAH88_16305, partial [Roseimicrobium sp.]